MEEEGRDHFYFQDDLGSPMRLTDEAGRSEEAYGFDEFGNDIWTAKDIFQDSMQSFGFTGYQMDSAGGLYFAQARRYDSGIGRFVSEDIMRGHIAVPFTMNHYIYCWNRPMDLVDLNGMWPEDPTAGVTKALTDMQRCDKPVSYIFYTTGEGSDFSKQAGVIEELNATIDTVVSLAADTAKETKSASERVKASASKANEEREKMNGLLTEMERITEISKEIGNIITDIEDIASQTNLLSLNASIEAARAGEAGRGFAVVADQIGKLASDSAKSVINTRELIDKTLVEIGKGNAITRTTADAFNQIIADMESFAEMAQNTMEKANSQADSLEQIGQGIEQLSGVVQGTAASSEENTAISVNLADEAAKMQDHVKTFKLF